MQILVDTSIWIDYFKSGENSSDLDELLAEDRVVTNDIILAELIPLINLKRQNKIIELLRNIIALPLNIDWNQVIDWQTMCLTSGFNGIGISDLLIAQNARQNDIAIYSMDKHFRLIKQVADIKLFINK